MRRIFAAATLAFFAIAAPPASAAIVSDRIVTAVDVAAKTFSCSAGPGDPVYVYKTNAKTRVRISGKRVRLSDIWESGNTSALKVGETVSVQYHISGADRIAERVVIYPQKK